MVICESTLFCKRTVFVRTESVGGVAGHRLLGSREAWPWLRDGLLVWPEVMAQDLTLVVARLLRFVS